jgi:hypothetical protein
VNQIIEDMLRAYVLNDGPKWGKHYVEVQTGRVLLQQQLSRERQDITFQSTLWMTLLYTAMLV